jgi:predicted HD phosphohydrolase
MDRDAREAFRDNPHFAACEEFCAKYDQAAFDPAYESEPLSFFEPMVRRVMAKPLRNMMAGPVAN